MFPKKIYYKWLQAASLLGCFAFIISSHHIVQESKSFVSSIHQNNSVHNSSIFDHYLTFLFEDETNQEKNIGFLQGDGIESYLVSTLTTPLPTNPIFSNGLLRHVTLLQNDVLWQQTTTSL